MISETEKKSRDEQLTIDKGVPLGEVLRSGQTKVEVSREINDEQIRSLYSLIERGFATHNKNSFLKQDMTIEEFEREARDRSVLKYLAKDLETSEIQGYLSVHTNLDDISWADVIKLKELQDNFGNGEQSFYVSTFLVPEELRGYRLSGVLLEAALSQFIGFNNQNGNRSLCFFDRSDSGSAAMREFIDRKLQRLTGEGPPFSVSEVDRVTYYRLSGGPESVREVRGDPPPGSETIDTQHFYQITPPLIPNA